MDVRKAAARPHEHLPERPVTSRAGRRPAHATAAPPRRAASLAAYALAASRTQAPSSWARTRCSIRRQEGVSLWVVPAASIVASSPDERDAFFDPAADKIYRHPTFYDVPEGVEHL